MTRADLLIVAAAGIAAWLLLRPRAAAEPTDLRGVWLAARDAAPLDWNDE